MSFLFHSTVVRRDLIVLAIFGLILRWGMQKPESVPGSGRAAVPETVIPRGAAGHDPALPGEPLPPLEELMGRFHPAHPDWSAPQPLSQAMVRLEARIREVNYLRRPELDGLKLPSLPDAAMAEGPMVSCPLPEPTLLVLLQWFAAQLRTDLTVGRDGQVRFEPWPDSLGHRPARLELPMQTTWFSSPQGDCADPTANSLHPLGAAELLRRWGIFPGREETAALTSDGRHLVLHAQPSTLLQAATLTGLRQHYQPPVYNVTLRLAGGDPTAPEADRIVATPSTGAWTESNRFTNPSAQEAALGRAASGEMLVLERIAPLALADQPDWTGVWAGLQLRAEGEVVRISGSVELRTNPAGEGLHSSGNVSSEVEFEAMVPRGHTALILLNTAVGQAPVQVAISVE